MKSQYGFGIFRKFQKSAGFPLPKSRVAHSAFAGSLFTFCIRTLQIQSMIFKRIPTDNFY